MTDILTIIRTKQAEKASAHIEPNIVTFREIMEVITKEAKDELNRLVGEGQIEFHRNLNDISFNIKQ